MYEQHRSGIKNHAHTNTTWRSIYVSTPACPQLCLACFLTGVAACCEAICAETCHTLLCRKRITHQMRCCTTDVAKEATFGLFCVPAICKSTEDCSQHINPPGHICHTSVADSTSHWCLESFPCLDAAGHYLPNHLGLLTETQQDQCELVRWPGLQAC